MYIAPGQRQTAPRGQNFDVNIKALSLYRLAASFKEISLKSDFKQFFHDLIHVYSHGAGGIQPPRGQSFDVNRTFLSLRSSVTSFQSQTTVVSEKFFVLPFPIQKHKGPNMTLP